MKDQTSATTQSNFKKSYSNAVKGNTNIMDPKVQHLRKPNKQTSKKNHQLSWKSCYIQLKHNTALGNCQQESLSIQTRHEAIEIKKLNI